MGIDTAFCWTFKDDEPEKGLARLKSYGFDGFELWPDAIMQHGVESWALALAATDMRCFQLCPYFNFMGGEETIAQSRQMLSEFIGYATEMKCSRLRVFTGPPWGEGVVGGREATSRQWEDAIVTLQEFCDQTAPLGIELCLECHEGSLMEDGPSALRLLHGVDRKNLTTNLQLPLLRESWEESLRLLGDYTTHIHIHNWSDRMGSGNLTFQEDGVFDWRPVVRDLCVKRGRRVCLSVEHANHHGRVDPWETAQRDGPFLRKLQGEVAAAVL